MPPDNNEGRPSKGGPVTIPAKVIDTNRSASVSQPNGRHEFVVRYRRAGWSAAQARLYQSRPPADRFAHKLRGGGRGWAAVVDLRIERRPVGDWQPA